MKSLRWRDSRWKRNVKDSQSRTHQYEFKNSSLDHFVKSTCWWSVEITRMLLDCVKSSLAPQWTRYFWAWSLWNTTWKCCWKQMDQRSKKFKNWQAVIQHSLHSFNLAEIKTLMMQLLAGCAYLHGEWVIHRDLKTSNLLLSQKQHPQNRRLWVGAWIRRSTKSVYSGRCHFMVSQSRVVAWMQEVLHCCWCMVGWLYIRWNLCNWDLYSKAPLKWTNWTRSLWQVNNENNS